jgi:tripartite-type tricarboxylate transporter receptor subunit TctC
MKGRGKRGSIDSLVKESPTEVIWQQTAQARKELPMSGKVRTLVFLVCFSLMALSVSYSSIASAQVKDDNYPSRPITLIVPYSAGGATDLEARLAATYLKNKLGQPVLVENKSGGGGAIGHREVAFAKPDGYTIGITGFPDASVLVALKGQEVGFKNDDLLVIGTFTNTPGALTVRKDGPFKTLKDFISYAKQNPGKLKISAAGQIFLLHAFELEDQFGVELNPIMFKGGGETVNALLGGHVDAMMAGSIFPMTMQDKGLVSFAVTGGSKRLEKLPDVPTMKELGYDMDYSLLRIFFVSKSTPEPIVKKLTKSLMELNNDPEFVEKLKAMGQIYAPMFGPELEKYYTNTCARISKAVEKHSKRFVE